MADSAKDRFSMPDESSIIRGASEEGIKRKWEDVYHPEEVESEDFISPKDRVRGGGESGIDRLFAHPESTDPEMLHLYKEFVADKKLQMYLDDDHRTWLSLVPRDLSESGAKELFGLWLAGEDKKEGDKKEGTMRINLKKVGYDTEIYDKFTELTKVWSDPATGVAFKFGDRKDPKTDKIVFVNDKKQIAINVSDFNNALEKSDIRMRIKRPRRENNRQAMGVLHHLRLGAGVFKGNKFAVEFPKKKETGKSPEIDRENFNLVINRRSLERKVDEKEKGNIEDFWGNWAKVKNMAKSDIAALGFGVENGKISTVIMKLKSGEAITIPSYVFRSVFDGVGSYHDRNTDNVTGFHFRNIRGERGYIHPHTPEERLAGVMKKLRMNGVPLPEDTRFFIGPYKKESPAEVKVSHEAVV